MAANRFIRINSRLYLNETIKTYSRLFALHENVYKNLAVFVVFWHMFMVLLKLGWLSRLIGGVK
jgi:hypothetical protein